MSVDSPCDRRTHPARKWLGGLLCLAILAGGCKRPEGGKTVITYSIWGSVAQQATEEKIAKAFEAENPDVKVEILRIGSRYTEKIQAMMVGDVAPDVMMVEIALYDEWATRGVLEEVTADVQAATENNPLMPVVQRSFERNGRYFIFPNNCHGMLLFANLDVLAKAGITLPKSGMTWDDLLALAPRLLDKSKPGGVEYLGVLPSFDLLGPSFGVRLFDNPNAPTKVIPDEPALREALTYLRKMRQTGYFAPADVTADQGSYQLFRDGRVAFHFDGRWRTPDLAGKTDFVWDVFPPLAGPAGNATVHGGSGLGIWSKSPNKEAAHRFVRFYCTTRGIQIAMHGGRTIPVFRDAAYGKEFLALRPPESIELFCDTMKSGASYIYLYAAGLNQARAIVSPRIEQLMYDPNTPVENVQKAIEIDLNRWLARRKTYQRP